MKATLIKSTACLFLLTAVSFSEVDIDTFTTINAFTSASIFATIKVHESKVYKNHAKLNWEEYYPIDSKVRAFFFRIGKAPDVYDDTLTLTPYVQKTINTLSIDSLDSATKYYAQFYTDYNGRLDNRNFVFTTPPLDPIPPVSDTDGGYIAAVNRRINVSPKLTIHQRISSVEITTMNGKQMYKYAVPSVSSAQKALSTSHLATGLYIIYYKDLNNIILSSDKLLVNK